MNIHTLKTRWILPALSCAVIGMPSLSKAAVTIAFEQDGSNVRATWLGTLNLTSFTNDFNIGGQERIAGPTRLRFTQLGSSVDSFAGVAATTGLVSSTISSRTGIGSFGWNGSSFLMVGANDGFPPASTLFTFNGSDTMTWNNTTLDALNASGFNNVVAWTAGGSGDTVSFNTVPEPSSVGLMGLGCVGLLLRRRR